MMVTTPLWLLGLAPWAALCVYLFTARARKLPVPFLALWREPTPPPRNPKRRRPPPLFILAVLAATLLAVVSSAGPVLRRGAVNRPVVFVVDRGFSMSARDGGDARFTRLARTVAPQILDVLGAGPADVVFVPGRSRPADRAGWVGRVEGAGRTAIDTKAAVAAAVRHALLEPDAVVVVLSDQQFGIDNPRVVQVVPAVPARNVGISRSPFGRSPPRRRWFGW